VRKGKTRCFNCNGTLFTTKFDHVASVQGGEYAILQCQQCSMAFAQDDRRERVDYSEYGDHITREEDGYYLARVNRVSLTKRILLRSLKKQFGLGAAILDYGCGAGFFMKSCENYGFSDVWGVEPSNKLRRVAHAKLNIDGTRIMESIKSFHRQFDVIAMLDVIEHLPASSIDAIMTDISDRIRPGGVLLGTTPNLNSLNVKMFGHRDPVIAPPQHCVYFVNNSLDSFLRKLGLRKRLLLEVGLSTSSFFRVDKFSPSWVERPKGWQRPPAFFVRTLFAGLGALLIPIGAGYSMYFIYEKTRSSPASRHDQADIS
jgi:SAM-dependent methyltransferase